MLKKLLNNKKLLLILLLALTLRLIGINHGFPFIFHVDEPALVRSAYNIRFDANPAHFDWPHFHFYLNFVFYFIVYSFRGLVQTLGLKEPVSALIPILWRDPLIFYLISRILSAFMGALTVVPVYLCAKKLFGVKVANLSAIVMAIFPYHVHASHYALIDVPMAFWFTWSVYFSVMVFYEKKYVYYLLAGIFAGLAASTKYNGAFALIFLGLTQLFMLPVNKNHFINLIKGMLLSTFAFVLVFFVSMPYALIDFGTFVRNDSPKGALWQFSNVGKVSLKSYFPQLIQDATSKFINDFGYSIIILFDLYIFYLLFTKKTKEKMLIYFPTLLFFMYISSFEKNRLHYYMFIFPLMSICVSKLALDVSEGFKKKFLTYILLLVMIAPPLFSNFNDLVLLVRQDTRNEMAYFLSANTKKSDLLFYSGGDLDEPMKKFKFKKISSLLALKDGANPKFLIVAVKNDISEKEDYESIKESVSLSKFIDSAGRMGPKIYIFSIKQDVIPAKAGI